MGRSSKRKRIRAAKTGNSSDEDLFLAKDGGEYKFRNGVSIRELKLLPTAQFPLYIPPVELSEIYDDWRNDRSREWLKYSPDDYRRYTHLVNAFSRYQEYCTEFPCDEYFHEWLKNDGVHRFMSWKINSWKIQQFLTKGSE